MDSGAQGAWALETDVNIAAAEFLRAIFSALPDGECASYSSPSVKDDGDVTYITRRLHPQGKMRRSATHFCPLALADDAVQNGVVKRSKGNLRSMHALVVDDVGEKASGLNLEPSWAIETKPGSWQMGYLLDEPVDDLQAVDDLLFTLGSEGMTDSGAAKTTQIFRLPGSKPPGKTYDARLRVWNPKRVYPFAALVEAVGGQLRRRAGSAEGADGPSLPEGTVIDDPFTNWLRQQGWYIGEVGASGFESIVCPWGEGHSNGDPEAGYHPPTEGDARRAFSCFHDHCSERSTADFVDWCVERGAPDLGTTYEVERRISDLAGLFGDLPLPPGVAEALTSSPEPEPPPAATPTPEGGWTLPDDPYNALRFALGDVTLPMPDYHVDQKSGAAVYHVTVSNIRAALRGAGVQRAYDLVEQQFTWRASRPEVNALIHHLGPADARNAIADELCEATGKAAFRTLLGEMGGSFYSPAAEYLDGLREWDGEGDPIGELIALIPAQDTELCDLVMRKWFIQAVQAAYNSDAPDQEYRAMELLPIFSGGQNLGKTTFIERIAPRRLTAIGGKLALQGGARSDTERDAIRQLTACWIGELGEFESTTRDADIEVLKRVISQRVDRYRLPFGKDIMNVPRSAVWIATANTRAVLQDRTGNRRFGVIFIKGDQMFGWLKHGLRDRVWAQARALWEAGTPYALTREEVAFIEGRANADAMADDIVNEALDDYFSGVDLAEPEADWEPMTLSHVVDAICTYGAEQGRYVDFRSYAKRRRMDYVRAWLARAGATLGKWNHPSKTGRDGQALRVDRSYRLPSGGPLERVGRAARRAIAEGTHVH